MSQQEKLLMIAMLLLANSSSMASVVSRTVPSYTSSYSGSYVFSFSEVTQADQLLSVTGYGGLSGSEGGNFSVALHTTAGSQVQVYSGVAISNNWSFNFNAIPTSALFAASNIDGIVFNWTQASFSTLTLDQGLTFNFDVVDAPQPPATSVAEPSDMALAGLAGVAALWVRRRRGAVVPAQSATCE